MLSAYQIPVEVTPTTAVYHVENITVTVDKTKCPPAFSYELVEYDETEQDWSGRPVTKREAERFCLVDMPTVFVE